jgi:predicted phosphodiesterase
VTGKGAGSRGQGRSNISLVFAKRAAFILFAVVIFLGASCFGPKKHVEVPPEFAPDADQLRALFELPVSATPQAAVDLRFVVMGDWGTGTAAQTRMAEIMCEVRRTQPFTYVLTTGDNFYGPDGKATDNNYYGPEYCLYSYPGNQWRPAWGNHDYGGDATKSVLGVSISPRYYTWTAGDVAFFVYDGSNVTSQQRQWLRDQVCGSTARVKVIYGHQPAFSVGPHGSDGSVQAMVAPVARECGVQVVFAGHDHLYARTKAIDGVTYVVTGGAGGVLYDCESKPSWLELCLSKTHFLLAEVTGSAVRVKAIGLDGGLVDSFEVAVGGSRR